MTEQQIKFTHLHHADRDAEPCVLCEEPTRWFASYVPFGDLHVEKPLCAQCVKAAADVFAGVTRLRAIFRIKQ